MAFLDPENWMRLLNRRRASRRYGRFGPPAGSVNFDRSDPAVPVPWSRIRAALEYLLLENIVPFWYPKILDASGGGYRLHYDRAGRWRGPVNKRLVTQSRTVWFFSRLFDSPHGRPEHLEAARGGFGFLRDRMWDPLAGGFFWEVNEDGTEATRPDKHLYGQAFGLYALSRYASASGDPAATALARELFELLEHRAHDGRFGGYFEFFRRDWEPAEPDAATYLAAPARLKLMNTHLHLLEAVTEYYRLTRDSRARERLVELSELFSGRIATARGGACTDRFERDWTRCREAEDDRTSYGHNLECIWLIAEARAAAGCAGPGDADLYRALFQYAVRYGFDAEGGFHESGPLDSPADRRDRIWWVQAEALVSALYLHRLTGEAEYREFFERILRWIGRRQADWQHGDWHARITPGGRIRGNKADAWKSPYHNGRAMIQCLEIVSGLEPARGISE